MKKILIFLFILFSISSYAQKTWVQWNGQWFLKTPYDSTHYGEDVWSDMPGIVAAINAKQPPLVSGTNIKTINGQPVLGTGDLIVSAVSAYTLFVQALTSSPADGQTIFFGSLPRAPSTSAATNKVFVRQAGTIKRVEIYCYSGTAGTNEAWVLSLRKNNTTDTQISSVSVATNERVFSATNLNIAMAAGDYFEIKCVNPTWATNPLTTIFAGYIFIE